MAFFDNIGKQITNVSQNVAQQTKNLANITQLNSAISDKQGQIHQLYLSLGQAYYEAHKNDPAAEEAEKIQQLNNLFYEISQNRDKIVQIRGINTCPNCGGEIPAQAQFCNFCGSKIEKDTSVQTGPTENLCPKCGTVVPEGNAFCNQCGNKL